MSVLTYMLKYWSTVRTTRGEKEMEDQLTKCWGLQFLYKHLWNYLTLILQSLCNARKMPEYSYLPIVIKISYHYVDNYLTLSYLLIINFFVSCSRSWSMFWILSNNVRTMSRQCKEKHLNDFVLTLSFF